MRNAVQRILAYVAAQGGRAPDAILPEKAGHRPHLFYAPSIAILCPEPGESIDGMRYDLEDAGYQVVVVFADQELGPQLASYRFWQAGSQ